MTQDTNLVSETPAHLDYSLTGVNATLAVEKGLAEADWYQCPVPRETMRKLLERRDGPAIRDTLLWFALLLGSGYATYALWGSWWAILPYLAYCALYAATSDSRWHESGHGTAFKTDWMNNALYEVASFMVKREATVWRWSHTRHHSDTTIVGRDPEILAPRPPNIKGFILSFFCIHPDYPTRLLRHAFGRMRADEKTYIPESEFPKIYLRARIYLLLYAGSIGLSVYLRSFLPVLYICLPNLFGTWLLYLYAGTQHAGLAENVLDHRLNCRTVYMNPVNRYLYWNMNYHVEHHMFPLVPYHALPQLHAAVRDDMPEPYPSILSAWSEIIPAVRRQMSDYAYHIRRALPAPKARHEEAFPASDAQPDAGGWIEVCAAADLGRADVIRFDHGKRTYALYRDEKGTLYATDGFCTHGNTHLSEGLVKGGIIECAKHNGRFNLSDGSPARTPVCRGLATYPLEERAGRLRLNIARAGGAGAREQRTYWFRVVSNRSVATFIKELVLEPLDSARAIAFTPGDYLQFDIPTYESVRFREFDIPEPFATVWENQHVFDLVARNAEPGRRNNYSIASNAQYERTLRFNVRISTPPPGQDCPPGVGSSYVFNLKPGDSVTAIGPFGDFHIKPTQREMVYIGGGAGMAPLRAHLSHLLETEKTSRKVCFWYGARSRQEIFYDDYFQELAQRHPNFAFHVALSAPLPEDNWTGHLGFIHEVVRGKFLREHANPKAAEYYLCGPPLMIKACNRMLAELGVPSSHIAYDEF
jgi:MocE subfamily Rieske [2Fe-2S] domain protein